MTSPLGAISASSPSYVWTSIYAARKILLLGIRQKIHSGYEVKVWEDPWIPTTPARPATPVAPVMHPNMRVSDLINQKSKEWDVGPLEDYVHPDDIPLICSMAISSTHRRDTFCWNYTRNGQYTVKSGYWLSKYGPYQQFLQAQARNDKLFRGIDREPLELVRYAESECQAWFNANEMIPLVVQASNNEEIQVLSLGNICLLDGSWTASDRFSGCGWVWMDSGENIQLMGTRNFTRYESPLHSEVEALRWATLAMPELRD
ncbi:PREDICTED: uncharacterized protein LOC106302674 [Brassica oleracea var. oleracea]|uniref:uncharacterized protein LOC106302674 n=1 Tax=Brassica oleracea var. oleracea TaxID=109376 RepID=UPI0006A70564|nr:PREDICTED: uncharacterized protein LOC106302674 [Brassica oleracea var. oleracea]